MKVSFLIVLFLSIFLLKPSAEVKPSTVFGDSMVLQRHMKAPIWGTSEPGEMITISVNGEEVKGKADKKGVWNIKLPEFEAGGPYDLAISGESNKVVFKNVMFGEVWFASGQSNMMYHMERGVPNGEVDIAAANYENIRLFHHPKTLQQHPVKTPGGGTWQSCTPENVKSFSAVAYYFAREIHQNYDVPVGIVLSGWGGTQAEAWCSDDV